MKFNQLFAWENVKEALQNKSGDYLCVLSYPISNDGPGPIEPEPDIDISFGVNDNFQLTATVNQGNIVFDTPSDITEPDYGKLIIKESVIYAHRAPGK